MTVKKVKKILLIIIPVLLIALLIYVAFKEITPLDDTKKLYINCGSTHENYDVLTGNKISFAPNDEKCKLNLEIRDVERNFVKLNSTLYLYKMDGNNNIIDRNVNELDNVTDSTEDGETDSSSGSSLQELYRIMNRS